MCILYYIRHGETEYNKKNVYTGWKDIDLNKKGIEQANILGKQFKDKNIDIIISSPLLRAKRTAEIINVYVKKEILFDARFKEINVGKYEGLAAEEVSAIIQEKYRNDIYKFYFDNSMWGEDVKEAEKRVCHGLDDIKEQYSDRTILLITHGFILRIINKYLNPDISFLDFFNYLEKNASVAKVIL